MARLGQQQHIHTCQCPAAELNNHLTTSTFEANLACFPASSSPPSFPLLPRQVGSLPLALSAAHLRVPVYMVADTFKVAPSGGPTVQQLAFPRTPLPPSGTRCSAAMTLLAASARPAAATPAAAPGWQPPALGPSPGEQGRQGQQQAGDDALPQVAGPSAALAAAPPGGADYVSSQEEYEGGALAGWDGEGTGGPGQGSAGDPEAGGEDGAGEEEMAAWEVTDAWTRVGPLAAKAGTGVVAGGAAAGGGGVAGAGPAVSGTAALGRLWVLNVYFESVPLELLAGVVTETGAVGEEGVRSVADGWAAQVRRAFGLLPPRA